VVAELKSQQNIIAVLVDDSRSMAIADSGSDGKQSREAAADARSCASAACNDESIGMLAGVPIDSRDGATLRC